jgi:modification methylase
MDMRQNVVIGSSKNMSAVPNGSIKLVMTSPPYWNLKDYQHPEQIGATSYDVYLNDLAEVWSECFAKAADSAIMVINVNSRRHQKRFYPIAFDIASRMAGWQLWDHLIWYIPNALPQCNHYMERLFDNKYESLLIFVKGDPDRYTFHKPRVPQKYRSADPRAHKKNINGRCLGNVIRIPAYRPPNVKELGYHIAAYPEELVALMVQSFTDPGDTVLDPFLGSGTTLKVCRVMGRNAYGYELNPHYEPLIQKRIAEEWEVPEWTSIDILHSSSMTPGMQSPRKIQYHRKGKKSRAGSADTRTLFTE